MSFVQHTKCVQINDKKYPSWAPRPTTTLILLSIPVLLASLAVPYLALIEIPLLIAYCEWWLYDRLICLGGEACAIGLLGKVEPPDKKTGFDKLDTDFSINLVLAPHNIQELPAGYPGNVPPPPAMSDAKAYYHDKYLEAMHHAIADDPIQGNLIREQATTHDEGWDFLGYFNTFGGSRTISTYQAYLHCEFEGGGIYQFLQMLYALLVIATAAAVICSIPVLGWIACGIAAVVAAIVAIAGIVAALNDTGSPTVILPDGKQTDQLHPASDILFVKGDWVMDTAHEGWNEIHPIKLCLLVGTAQYESDDKVDWDQAIGPFMVSQKKWSQANSPDPKKPIYVKTSGSPTPDDWKAWVKSHCDATGEASSAVTIHYQGQPEHLWEIHPAIDGCRPTGRPDPAVPILH